ncbi:MAG TPA: ATP-dependent Zn protease [Elainellaceae cyanobacterium]
MGQTSLNLLAITLFSLVMMSVFGPLINLSPAVPAIAVFGLLSIATVDTLAWQGRGSTLLLDWVARFSPEHRRRIVHHEAGHFLIAHLLDIPITGYTLSAWDAFRRGQPGLGGVSFDSQELDAQLESGALSSSLVDRYCKVWMAGIAAETLTYGNAEGGEDDRQKMRILWTQLRRPMQECNLKERWSALQAKTLLETHHTAYEALVNSMEQGKSVEACLQILEQNSRTL